MLTEILMESLMSMDEDTLDYVLESCTDDEIEIISDAMEASINRNFFKEDAKQTAADMRAMANKIKNAGQLSPKDKEDFNTIERIQRKARSSGWGSVPKEDRDEFVNIMSHSKNLSVLKKAKKLGEREATNDSKVKSALRSLGATAAGSAIGAGAGAGLSLKLDGTAGDIGDSFMDYNIGKRKNISYMTKAMKDEYGIGVSGLQDYIDDASAYSDESRALLKQMGIKPGVTVTDSNYNSIYKKAIKGLAKAQASDDAFGTPFPTLGKLNTIADKLEDANTSAAKTLAGAGAVAGGLAGAGTYAAIKGIKNKIRYEKDKKAVMAQGDAMHPDAQWKLNRKYGSRD